MSAIVCLYVIGITTLVAAAAAAIEWAVQGRIPTRHLWSAAMVCALLAPPLAIVQHARGVQRSAVSPVQGAFVEVVDFSRAAGAAMGSRERGSPLHTLRDEYHVMLDRASRLGALLDTRMIVALWLVASLALVAWIASGVAHWERARSEWEETELDGVSVHLSEQTGPAVLGVVSQRIVLPAWVRTLAPDYRKLMLAHECEHIAARDPQRLALALGALVLMPWNPTLWWCAARLRRAIELDCDARVLRVHPSPRAYGYLLLQVAARGNNAGPLAVPLVNLLRLPSELELRLRAMTRPRTIAGRTLLAGVACAAAAMSAAFTTPVPHATRATVRNLMQAARARLTSGTHQGVRVGSVILQLDSATVTSDRRSSPGRLRRTLVVTTANARTRDTLPSAVAEDSLQRLARRLAEQAEQLDSVRARAVSLGAQVRRAESLAAEARGVRAGREIRVTGGVARLAPGGRKSEELAKMGAGEARARAGLAASVMRAEFARSAAHIDSALARYYPHLANDTSATTLIWFVADSSGKILHTARDEDKPYLMTTELATQRFPDVDPHAVDFVSIRRWTVGTRRIAVAWIGLKR